MVIGRLSIWISRIVAACGREARQVIGDGATQSFLDNRRKDQARALQRLHDNPELRGLEVITAPLFDLEVRGLPALEYFGRQVWK